MYKRYLIIIHIRKRTVTENNFYERRGDHLEPVRNKLCEGNLLKIKKPFRLVKSPSVVMD